MCYSFLLMMVYKSMLSITKYQPVWCSLLNVNLLPIYTSPFHTLLRKKEIVISKYRNISKIVVFEEQRNSVSFFLRQRDQIKCYNTFSLVPTQLGSNRLYFLLCLDWKKHVVFSCKDYSSEWTFC